MEVDWCDSVNSVMKWIPLDSFSSLGFWVFLSSGDCPLGGVPSSDHLLKLVLSRRALPLSQGMHSDSLTGSLDLGGSCVEVDWCESVNSVMKWNPYRGTGFALAVFLFCYHNFQGYVYHAGTQSVDLVLGFVGGVICHFVQYL